jgi:nucleotide-binding universal stress UspA family protein
MTMYSNRLKSMKSRVAPWLRVLSDHCHVMFNSFPRLGDAVGADDLPVPFILKRDSRREKAGNGGNVVDRILDHAGDCRSDLIVIGTRGRSGVARAILGSVADRVLRQAECPVLTVPPTGEDVTTNLDATVFDPILCASDCSASCKKALDVGLWVGEQEGARVILLNVMQWPTSVPTAGLPPATINALPTRRELEWEARERLVAALPTDTSHRYRPEVMVESGRPSDVILRIAADEAVTLIVMGVTSRGAFDQMIFGSTIRSVIQAAHCPVLSVRADAYDARWPRAAGEPTDLVALRSEN